ncbi:MAG: LysM peptidoglycan-binding domain-containing protein, partial [Chloroflexi bacterium]
MQTSPKSSPHLTENKRTGHSSGSSRPRLCPCLGTVDDSETKLAFASEWNQCYRSGKPTSVDYLHQQQYCLRANHAACSVFRYNNGVPPSGGMPQHNLAKVRPQVKRRVWVVAFSVMMFVLSISLTAAFWWPRTPDLSNPNGPTDGGVVDSNLSEPIPTARSALSFFQDLFLPDEPTISATVTPTRPLSGSLTGGETAVSPTPPTLCNPPLFWVIYTVQPGDTIFTLAQRTGTTASILKISNCLNSDSVSVGDRLYLPQPPPPTIPNPPLISQHTRLPPFPTITT